MEKRLWELISHNDAGYVWKEEYDARRAAVLKETGASEEQAAEYEASVFSISAKRALKLLDEGKRITEEALSHGRINIGEANGLCRILESLAHFVFLPWHSARTEYVKARFAEAGGVEWLIFQLSPQWRGIAGEDAVGAAMGAVWSYGDAGDRRRALVRGEVLGAILEAIRGPTRSDNLLHKSIGALWGLLEFPAAQRSFAEGGGIASLGRLLSVDDSMARLSEIDQEGIMGCLTSAVGDSASCLREDAAFVIRAVTKRYELLDPEEWPNRPLLVLYQACLYIARVIGSGTPHADAADIAIAARSVGLWRTGNSFNAVHSMEHEHQYQWVTLKPFVALTRSLHSREARLMGGFALANLCLGRENRRIAGPFLQYLMCLKWSNDPQLREYGSKVVESFDAYDATGDANSDIVNSSSDAASAVAVGEVPTLKHLSALRVFERLCESPTRQSDLDGLIPEIRELVLVE